MSTFVGIPPFSNPLWVAMETMHFYIAQTNFFEDTFDSHPGSLIEQFGTHDKLFWGGGGGHGHGCRGYVGSNSHDLLGE